VVCHRIEAFFGKIQPLFHPHCRPKDCFSVVYFEQSILDQFIFGKEGNKQLCRAIFLFSANRIMIMIKA